MCTSACARVGNAFAIDAEIGKILTELPMAGAIVFSELLDLEGRVTP